MKLWSDSWANGERIPRALRGRQARRRGRRRPSPTTSTRTSAWSDLPAGTQSLALICHDFDVPSRGDDVNQADREVPADLPRVDFFHWVLVDVPAALRRGSPRARSAAASRARGKRGPAVAVPGFEARARASTTTPAGSPATPRWPATTSATTGRSRRSTTRSIHHYVFTLYALTSRAAPVEGTLQRRRGCARRSPATCSPRRRTPAPTR